MQAHGVPKVYLYLTEDTKWGKKGHIVEASYGLVSPFFVANSFVELLQDFAQNLISGNYVCSKKSEIIRYLLRDTSCS